MTKTAAIALAALALSGCASLDKQLANRIACTADGKGVLIASMYGPLGVASKADTDDAAAIIKSGCGKQ
jgi:hypothetical protein